MRSFLALVALLVSGTACAAPPAPLSYRLAQYRFAAPNPDDVRQSHPERADRDVAWSYPVFDDAHDPALRALNGWLRLRSLELLLAHGPLLEQARHLTDRQVIERAIKDQDFIDGAVDQAVVLPTHALGRYVDFEFFGEMIGSLHADHQHVHALYDLRTGREQPLEELFDLDEDGVLDELFEREKAGLPGCTAQPFSPASYLAGSDAIGVEFAYRSAEYHACGFGFQVSDPRIRALLKSPADLEPARPLDGP